MEKSFNISFKEIDLSDLSEKDQSLVDSAINALDTSHSPYSKFKVGTAVRMVDDQVFEGSNQENAAYPSGLCAERVALFKAKSENLGDIDSIAVVARNGGGKAADAFSCGNCRQVMLEYASMQNQPIKILMQGSDEKVIVVEDVRNLLPFNFSSTTLK